MKGEQLNWFYDCRDGNVEMSWEEMKGCVVCQCPCGKGVIERIDYADDWNRYKTEYVINCANCSDEYSVEREITGWQHPGHESTRVYLVPRDYPLYNGPTESSRYGLRAHKPSDFSDWLIENIEKENLRDAREELLLCGNCSHVQGAAKYIVKERRALYHSARAAILTQEIERALENYDAHEGNAEQRAEARSEEMKARASYDQERRKHIIRVD